MKKQGVRISHRRACSHAFLWLASQCSAGSGHCPAPGLLGRNLHAVTKPLGLLGQIRPEYQFTAETGSVPPGFGFQREQFTQLPDQQESWHDFCKSTALHTATVERLPGKPAGKGYTSTSHVEKKTWFLLVHIAVQTGSSELYGFPMLWTGKPSLKNPKNYIHRFSLWPMKCSRLATWLRFKNLLKSLWKSNMVHRYALNILAFSEILSWKHFLFYFQNKLYMF